MDRDALIGPVRVAFAGTFARHFARQVQDGLAIPSDIVVGDESEIVAHLADMDVLVTLAFTRAMGVAARRLRLIQVPGAGLDRIDRGAIPAGVSLANAYGHEVAIAEHAMGAMLALTRNFCRIDARLRRGEWESQWSLAAPAPAPWPELAGKTLGILGHGRIGQALARRARAFDMEVWAVRRDIARSDGEGLAFVGGPEHSTTC